MSELYVVGLAVLAGSTVVIFALRLLFLFAVYVLSGRKKDYLDAAARASRPVRDVGVAAAISAFLERRPNRDAGSS